MTATETSYCATHPDVESYLKCSRCGVTICPRCLVHTQVGARCRACARLRRLPVFEAGPRELALGLAAGLGVALLGGALLGGVPGLGWLTLILTLGLGYLVGQAVAAATNRKRATSLAAVAAASALVGIPLGPLLVAALAAPGFPLGPLLGQLVLGLLTQPLRLLVLGLAALLAWHQVR